MRNVKGLFSYMTKTKSFYISIIVIIFIIFIVNRMGPRNYNYKQIGTEINCVKHKVDEQRYLLFPMITILYKYGLGNQLFEVFSLLGSAQTLNRTAIFNADDDILQSKLDLLQKQVPQVAARIISIPIEIAESTRYLFLPACCHYQFPSLFSCERSKFLVIDGQYFQSFKYFSAIDSLIRKLLKPPIDEEIILKKMIGRKDELRFKNCVHIRRGDYVNDFDHAETSSYFTIRAIDYVHTLHPGLVYLISDDPKWVRKQIAEHLDYHDDVKIMETPINAAIRDLYFSQAHCDSVLITAPSSTFGWWIGYMSKNQSNVYYRDIQETDDMVKYKMVEEDFFPPTWKKLGMSRNGSIISK
ncbi:Galactoside 2-alpha-L-fucosyltransferase [Caenorhabditis elegans]|uniref:Galactoside 2-alpha-L-fucosyltransferase n=1 Tax=Caenorhabditis elegans TaxID=6239 RepID=FUTB1_CAEEL|nr:Galactoside 2-alpha-L-fucosyltransferase [Caenorhabditis elegans]P91200.1 RecName: Full=Galactoside 2-alpha-L-fucosyltransferase; AltName: Full=Alpha-(1,2)-fucosyltransferase fut-2; AltName: Full=Fucosyltransferase fut-2 [Caenorhabditis elegans]CCD68841.1 Galactoside 2-alpha-L-fucosyltransferase [Caenorhabditis elegans]|eukprot:NP_504671.1 Galactoside 2-alpha-L-fucosyltransferase [Caenorhabditis elegans]